MFGNFPETDIYWTSEWGGHCDWSDMYWHLDWSGAGEWATQEVCSQDSSPCSSSTDCGG